jgi:tetratricopeptide (TPR) repeat protein
MGEELFTRQIRVLRLAVDAWAAQARGQSEHAVTQMEAAAELEFSTPKHAVTPAPTLPALELLGELLMEQGQPEKALAAFQRSLELYPRRFNSLLGAARAALALNDAKAATQYYQELVEISAPGSERVGLEEARRQI